MLSSSRFNRWQIQETEPYTSEAVGVCDRRGYLHWVFEAKKRFGLSVLNYVVTCNHVHLLVKDTGRDVISESIQLITGHSAQEYNQRKNRQGAFWEDRYHATAIEADEHLHRCLVYIDSNMVRAGVVNQRHCREGSSFRIDLFLLTDRDRVNLSHSAYFFRFLGA